MKKTMPAAHRKRLLNVRPKPLKTWIIADLTYHFRNPRDFVQHDMHSLAWIACSHLSACRNKRTGCLDWWARIDRSKFVTVVSLPFFQWKVLI
jgi:hypothetical protein